MPRPADGAKERQTAHRLGILDRDDVEQTITRVCLGCDDEPAAKTPTIGDREEQQRTRTVAVARITHQRTIAEDLPQSGDAVSQRTAKGGAVQRVDYRGVEAHSGNIEHVTSIDRRAVDRLVGTLGGESRHRDPGARRCGDRGDEIVARAAGEQSDAALRAGTRGDDGAGDLAPRPVAAEHRDRVGATVQRAPHAADFVARTAGDERLPDADAVERTPNGGEQFAPPAAASDGIDDKPD